MTPEDVSLLLAVLGGAIVMTSWLGHRKGDARRDVRLMASFGGFLLAAAGGVHLL